MAGYHGSCDHMGPRNSNTLYYREFRLRLTMTLEE